jgi:hypothetical protein
MYDIQAYRGANQAGLRHLAGPERAVSRNIRDRRVQIAQTSCILVHASGRHGASCRES